MGWSDDYLHQYTIYGKPYGITYSGGMSFSDDSRQIKLSDFSFQPNERFIYEYNFTGNWEHQIRLEEVLSVCSLLN